MAMGNRVIACLRIYIFIFFNTRRCRCNENSPNNSTLRCKPSERAALLNFKHNLTYFDKDVSSSWKGDECCEWKRVSCDNKTGHILQLHLNGDVIDYLLKMEKLESSLVYLLELKQLESLDMSHNDFFYSTIPRFMGSMKQLRYLYLSSASLGGLLPYQLGNLTNLQILDLSDNKLSGEIPTSLGNLSTLMTLDLSDNLLSGEILASLGNLSNLEKLYLYGNSFSSIASSLRFPSNLEALFLSKNQLSGKIPTSIGKLSMLQKLDISYNPLEGIVLSEPHFANLSSLTEFVMDETLLTLNLSSNWVPPFQLQLFSASSCKINGQLPSWLQTQKHLSSLVLSNANISGIIPRWFRTMQQLSYIDLSNNKLSGSPVFPINFYKITLSDNSLSGEILSNYSKTEVYHQACITDLSNNLIRGPFPEGLGHIMPNLEFLILTNNHINGPIPNSLCQLTLLQTIDIGNNSLSGTIPNCWSNVSSISVVNLAYNKLEGHIPCFNNRDSFKFGFNDQSYLHLNDNMLNGKIPSCLSDLTNLRVLDIGGNQLSSKMPKWFGPENFWELQILRLRGNKFSGTIPRQICSLPHLQLLDLGHNQFTGSIPPCLSNLTAMTAPYASTDFYLGGVSEVILGIERAFRSTLPYLVIIDLSYNNLVGSIPNDMTKISGLLSLNLSYNQLSGTIPENIGGLKSLISLDLSRNKLRGSIPTSIGELYMLSRLNMSYNNLSAQIPTGNQLETLSDQASIYAGNPYLCGDFLPKKCKNKVNQLGKRGSNEGNGGHTEKLGKMGFDLVLMSGLATGLWVLLGGCC